MDQNEDVYLLEVNSFPALHSGTMSNVPKIIYEKTLKDFINLVVFPVTDKLESLQGDFVKVES